MKHFFLNLINLGVTPEVTTLEKQRIQIFSIMCLLAEILLSVNLIVLFFQQDYSTLSIFLFQLVATVVAHYLQCIGKRNAGRLLLWVSHYFLLLIFSYAVKFYYPDHNYFVILAVAPLILVDNKTVHILGLVLCIIGFYAEDIWLYINAYSFDDLPNKNSTAYIWFVLLYITIDYFQRITLWQQKILQQKHDDLLEKQDIIEAQRKKLEQLNGFQSHFLVNLSHEIRTPLTLINGSINQIKKLKIDQVVVQKQQERISQNVKKINVLVDNIIDLAKMNVGKLSLNQNLINSSEFCKKLIGYFLANFNQKKISIQFEDQSDNCGLYIYADQLYMERALNNIFHNALKYTAEGGTFMISLSTKDDLVVMTFKDSGCGIPEEDLPYVFNSFYRAKNTENEAGGSGVGLAFTHEVIQLHNGSIKVESSLGVGTSLIISLPLIERKDAHTDDNSKQTKPTSIKDVKTLLLVEDNEEMRNYLTEILCDYRLLIAENGLEALKILKSDQPDCIITDYMMPVMNGYELIKKVYELGIQIPTIVLTARSDEQGKMNILRLGVDDYITKPFNENELLLKIAHLIRNNEERINFIEGQSIKKDEQVQYLVEDGILAQLNELIKANIDNAQFDIKELAEGMHMSERTLHRKVKAMTGLAPNQYVRELKMQKARELIRKNKDYNMKQIALAIGMNNQTYFAKLYKQHFGNLPNE